MRKLVSLIIIFAFIFSFASCGEVSTSSSLEISSSSSISENLPNSSYFQYEECFINEDLLSLIGEKNSKLKELYSGKCYAYGQGSGAEALVYYNPFIRFLFNVTDDPFNDWLSEAVESNPYVVDGASHVSNPFIDELTIMQILLSATYSTELRKVTSQDSLRQFLLTDEEITYALLADKLNQSPELEHEPKGTYRPTEQEYVLHEETLYIPVDGGVYYGTYSVSNIPLTVEYIKTGNDFVALYLVLGELKP